MHNRRRGRANPGTTPACSARPSPHRAGLALARARANPTVVRSGAPPSCPGWSRAPTSFCRDIHDGAITGLDDRFSNAACAHGRAGAQSLRDFMRNYLEREEQAGGHDAWFRRQVQIGLDAANAGDTISAEEVEAEAAVWRRQMGRKIGSASSGSSGRARRATTAGPSGTTSRPTTTRRHRP